VQYAAKVQRSSCRRSGSSLIEQLKQRSIAATPDAGLGRLMKQSNNGRSRSDDTEQQCSSESRTECTTFCITAQVWKERQVCESIEKANVLEVMHREKGRATCKVLLF